MSCSPPLQRELEALMAEAEEMRSAVEATQAAAAAVAEEAARQRQAALAKEETLNEREAGLVQLQEQLSTQVMTNLGI